MFLGGIRGRRGKGSDTELEQCGTLATLQGIPGIEHIGAERTGKAG